MKNDDRGIISEFMVSKKSHKKKIRKKIVITGKQILIVFGIVFFVSLLLIFNLAIKILIGLILVIMFIVDCALTFGIADSLIRGFSEG